MVIILTLDQLLMLTTVIELGSVQAASQKLNKTQPAISKGLKQLENQLQISMLDRTEYRLKLTPEGKQIYTHAQRVLAQADILQQAVQHIVKGQEAELRIAIDGAFHLQPVAKIFKNLQKKFPDTRVIIYEEFLTGAYEKLINNQADLAISLFDNRFSQGIPVESKHIAAQPLISVATKSMLAKYPNLHHIKQLENEKLIMLSDSGKLTKGSEFGSVDGQQKWYVDSLELKKQLIVNGLGWGKLPSHMVEQEIDTGQLTTLNLVGNENNIMPEYQVLKARSLGPVGTYLWRALGTLHNQKLN